MQINSSYDLSDQTRHTKYRCFLSSQYCSKSHESLIFNLTICLLLSIITVSSKCTANVSTSFGVRLGLSITPNPQSDATWIRCTSNPNYPLTDQRTIMVLHPFYCNSLSFRSRQRKVFGRKWTSVVKCSRSHGGNCDILWSSWSFFTEYYN